MCTLVLDWKDVGEKVYEKQAVANGFSAFRIGLILRKLKILMSVRGTSLRNKYVQLLYELLRGLLIKAYIVYRNNVDLIFTLRFKYRW